MTLRNLTLALTLILAGCSHLNLLFTNVEEPKVELYSVQLQKLSFLHIDLLIKLRISNPNDFSLEAREFQYKLKAQEKTLGQGTKSEKIIILPNSKKKLDFPLRLSTANTSSLIEAYLAGKESKINLQGNVTFETPAGDMKLEFNRTKTVKSHL